MLQRLDGLLIFGRVLGLDDAALEREARADGVDEGEDGRARKFVERQDGQVVGGVARGGGGAGAVLGFTLSLTPLASATHYRVQVSGSAVKAEPQSTHHTPENP